MRLQFAEIKELAIDAGKEWVDDKASRLGAAVAYYTIFSIAPLCRSYAAFSPFVNNRALSGLSNAAKETFPVTTSTLAEWSPVFRLKDVPSTRVTVF